MTPARLEAVPRADCDPKETAIRRPGAAAAGGRPVERPAGRAGRGGGRAGERDRDVRAGRHQRLCGAQRARDGDPVTSGPPQPPLPSPGRMHDRGHYADPWVQRCPWEWTAIPESKVPQGLFSGTKIFRIKVFIGKRMKRPVMKPPHKPPKKSRPNAKKRNAKYKTLFTQSVKDRSAKLTSAERNRTNEVHLVPLLAVATFLQFKTANAPIRIPESVHICVVAASLPWRCTVPTLFVNCSAPSLQCPSRPRYRSQTCQMPYTFVRDGGRR